jgi:hypothetical protein
MEWTCSERADAWENRMDDEYEVLDDLEAAADADQDLVLGDAKKGAKGNIDPICNP